MSQASLRTVTLKTVANYRHAAERAVGAYRLGGHRLIAVVRRGVDTAATRGAQRFAPRLAAAMKRAGDRVGSFAVKGVDVVSERTSRVIEIGSNGVRSQVERVAEMAGGVDYPVVVNSLKAAVRFSLPGAQAALALSERVAAGAAKLETVAAGPRSARAKAAAQRVRRAAPARGRSTAKTLAAVQADAKVATRRATRSVGKAVDKTTKAVAKTADSMVKAVAPKAARKPVARTSAKAPVKAAAKPVRRAAKKATPLAKAAQNVIDAVAAA